MARPLTAGALQLGKCVLAADADSRNMRRYKWRKAPALGPTSQVHVGEGDGHLLRVLLTTFPFDDFLPSTVLFCSGAGSRA